MANHIIRLKSDSQKTTQTIVPANNMNTEQAPAVASPYSYTIDTMTDPQMRVLQEIKFLLIVLVILKLICLFKKG